MSQVLEFDPSRIKTATNVSTTGTILTLPTLEAHDEDRDEVISLACTVLLQDPTTSSADALEDAFYEVMAARYRHVSNEERASKLIASGVSALMSDETIFDEVIDRLMISGALSV